MSSDEFAICTLTNAHIEGLSKSTCQWVVTLVDVTRSNTPIWKMTT
ncbi:MAG: hypothetical protein IJK94_00630 [Bacteroidaceae bacterium]|nr:hypothetical protein [Bacteroidaceae bacterium]